MRGRKIYNNLFLRCFFFAFLAVFTLISFEVLSSRAEQKRGEDLPVIVGTEIDYPPYSFLDENNNISGFNLDLTRALADTMDMDVEVKIGPWSRIMRQLKEGKIDAISGMYYSAERDKMFDFSTPYAVVHHAVFARSDSPDINSEKDLKGKDIIVMRGDIMHEYVISRGLSQDPILVNTQAEALKMLALGEHDYALLARLPGLYWVDKLDLSNIRTVGPLLAPSKYCYAVREGEDLLLGSFNEGLAVLEQSHRYKNLYTKWFGVLSSGRASTAQIIKYFFLLLTPVFFILVMSAIWVWTLKRKVRQRTLELQKEINEREKAENEIRKNEERLELALFGSYIGAWDWNISTGKVIFDEHWARMVGYRHEELLGHINTWEKMVHPDDLVIVSHKLHDHLRGKTDFYEAEYRMKHKSGRWIWIYDRGKVIERDVKGQAVRACGAHLDISKRKKMEQVLKESERQYRAIFEDPTVFVGMIDKEGVLLGANRTALDFVGKTGKELVGKKFWDTPWWTHSSKLQDKLKDSIKKASEGEYISFEASHIGAKGQEIIVHFTVRPVKDDNGNVTSLLCNGIDITRRIRDEQKIKHLNRVLRALSSVNQIITREGDPIELVNCASDCLMDSGGYKYVWIVLFNENGEFEHMAGEKIKNEFPEIENTLKNGKLFKCQEMALKNKEFVVLKDLAVTCTECPIAKKDKDLISFCMPIFNKEKIYGTITGALPQEIASSGEEENLFCQLTLDLSYALSKIESDKRTNDLRVEKEDHVRELEVFYDSAIDREQRIIQLKEQVEELKHKLKKGESRGHNTK